MYESILLIAMLSAATLIFILIFGDATQGAKHYLLQLFLWLVAGAYFVWCWVKGGQTLAMQTWRIRLISITGHSITFGQASRRYILATLFFGATFIWAFFDRDGLFLHDRLTGGRLVVLKSTPRHRNE